MAGMEAGGWKLWVSEQNLRCGIIYGELLCRGIMGLLDAAGARFAPGLFPQTVPKSLGSVSISLWYSFRSDPSPLLHIHFTLYIILFHRLLNNLAGVS